MEQDHVFNFTGITISVGRSDETDNVVRPQGSFNRFFIDIVNSDNITNNKDRAHIKEYKSLKDTDSKKNRIMTLINIILSLFTIFKVSNEEFFAEVNSNTKYQDLLYGKDNRVQIKVIVEEEHIIRTTISSKCLGISYGQSLLSNNILKPTSDKLVSTNSIRNASAFSECTLMQSIVNVGYTSVGSLEVDNPIFFPISPWQRSSSNAGDFTNGDISKHVETIAHSVSNDRIGERFYQLLLDFRKQFLPRNSVFSSICLNVEHVIKYMFQLSFTIFFMDSKKHGVFDNSNDTENINQLKNSKKIFESEYFKSFLQKVKNMGIFKISSDGTPKVNEGLFGIGIVPLFLANLPSQSCSSILMLGIGFGKESNTAKFLSSVIEQINSIKEVTFNFANDVVTIPIKFFSSIDLKMAQNLARDKSDYNGESPCPCCKKSADYFKAALLETQINDAKCVNCRDEENNLFPGIKCEHTGEANCANNSRNLVDILLIKAIFIICSLHCKQRITEKLLKSTFSIHTHLTAYILEAFQSIPELKSINPKANLFSQSQYIYVDEVGMLTGGECDAIFKYLPGILSEFDKTEEAKIVKQFHKNKLGDLPIGESLSLVFKEASKVFNKLDSTSQEIKEMTDNEIVSIQTLCNQFLTLFVDLFGVREMTYYTHILLHIARYLRICKKHGLSLTMINNEGFESNWKRFLGFYGNNNKGNDSLIQLMNTHYYVPILTIRLFVMSLNFGFNDARSLRGEHIRHTISLHDGFYTNVYSQILDIIKVKAEKDKKILSDAQLVDDEYTGLFGIQNEQSISIEKLNKILQTYLEKIFVGTLQPIFEISSFELSDIPKPIAIGDKIQLIILSQSAAKINQQLKLLIVPSEFCSMKTPMFFYICQPNGNVKSYLKRTLSTDLLENHPPDFFKFFSTIEFKDVQIYFNSPIFISFLLSYILQKSTIVINDNNNINNINNNNNSNNSIHQLILDNIIKIITVIYKKNHRSEKNNKNIKTVPKRLIRIAEKIKYHVETRNPDFKPICDEIRDMVTTGSELYDERKMKQAIPTYSESTEDIDRKLDLIKNKSERSVGVLTDITIELSKKRSKSEVDEVELIKIQLKTLDILAAMDHDFYDVLK
ncbi:hypothetical protein PPL_05441 [Heterostelium album PN500]|uniref:Uncharacterized protein n=1 Tax=Heterostelium pallidum (strain ATCC 26659 / Pp 5 / PN500) TaxID=670386 RepID=D3BA66_HETP5|nr:hypothetical protein PPL_06927 [Heterostelium album PN500]XP_020433571.1 hypothetical protein PPL_05441 [Heterostelium album PN500]EFA80105.1 hypothetical protein PPL_06927 [Heterostelium album PN500]EFA81453.1 hypothetical protein PPL_05441 [Heterostelium album PN500]|eukprot:XP_020432225.1 hypothetical protein PPL_06927 [Heterostelium album PN500]